MPFTHYSKTALACAPEISAPDHGTLPLPSADPVGAARAHPAARLRVRLVTITPFCGPLSSLLTPVRVPRDPANSTDPFPLVLFTARLRFLYRLGARRPVTHRRRQGSSQANFAALFGGATGPHGDPLPDTCCRLPPAELQAEVASLVETVIRKKLLYRYRLRGRFYVVAVDGTRLLQVPHAPLPTGPDAQPPCRQDPLRPQSAGGQTDYRERFLLLLADRFY